MSQWIALVKELREKHRLGPWGPIPAAHWPEIAERSGPEEKAEIERLLQELQRGKRETPEWDGDTHDDIWHAERFLTGVLQLIENRK
jgi:hypothetical protein